jgi:hypothetical protein
MGVEMLAAPLGSVRRHLIWRVPVVLKVAL